MTKNIYQVTILDHRNDFWDNSPTEYYEFVKTSKDLCSMNESDVFDLVYEHTDLANNCDEKPEYSFDDFEVLVYPVINPIDID